MNCESFYGKDNYKRCFNIVKYGKLIIFDRMGFGACIKDFYNLLLKHSELQILDYDSFEAFLLYKYRTHSCMERQFVSVHT